MWAAGKVVPPTSAEMTPYPLGRPLGSSLVYRKGIPTSKFLQYRRQIFLQVRLSLLAMLQFDITPWSRGRVYAQGPQLYRFKISAPRSPNLYYVRVVVPFYAKMAPFFTHFTT